MKSKKVSKKLFLLGLIGMLGMSSIAYAYQGDYSQKGPEYSEERHAIMDEAFKNNDYNTWKEAMTANGRTPRVVEVITEENFEKFVEAHEAGEAGDVTKADEIREELGLRTSNGEKVGAGHGKGNGQGKGEGRGQGNKGANKGMNKGQNAGGNFIDSNNDGECDNLVQ